MTSLPDPGIPELGHVGDGGPEGYIKRWRVHDSEEDYIIGYRFHHNPNKMTSLHPAYSISAKHTTAPDGQFVLYEGERAPAPWSFSGDILTVAQYEAMEFWFSRKWLTRLHVWDHFGRRILFVPQQFSAVAHPGRARKHYWRHTYDVEGLVLEVLPRTIIDANYPGHGHE